MRQSLEIIKQKNRARHHKNKTKANANRRQWHKENWDDIKEEKNAKLRAKSLQCKIDVLGYYSKGEIPQCVCCDEIIIEFLTMDHTEGRKLWNHGDAMSGMRLYRWLQLNGYPKGFQTMCMNCNFAKGHWGECPHNQ